MALQGTLDTFALPDVLRLLAATGKTGRLDITGDRGEGCVWVRSGQICGAAASQAPQAADDTEAVFELLRMASGRFVFEADAEREDAGEVVDVEGLLAGAEVLLEEWRALAAVVPSMDAWVQLRRALPDASVTIPAEQWAALAGMGGGRTVGQLGDDLGLGELPVSQVVRDLVSLGVAEVVAAAPTATPAPAASPGVDPAVVLPPTSPTPAAAVPAATVDLTGTPTPPPASTPQVVAPAAHAPEVVPPVSAPSAPPAPATPVAQAQPQVVAPAPPPAAPPAAAPVPPSASAGRVLTLPDDRTPGDDATTAGPTAAPSGSHATSTLVEAPPAPAPAPTVTRAPEEATPAPATSERPGVRRRRRNQDAPSEWSPVETQRFVPLSLPHLHHEQGTYEPPESTAAPVELAHQSSGPAGSSATGQALEDEMAKQMATLSPRAQEAMRAAASATTDEARDAAFAEVEDAEGEPVNRGMLLKFLSSVKS